MSSDSCDSPVVVPLRRSERSRRTALNADYVADEKYARELQDEEMCEALGEASASSSDHSYLDKTHNAKKRKWKAQKQDNRGGVKRSYKRRKPCQKSASMKKAEKKSRKRRDRAKELRGLREKIAKKNKSSVPAASSASSAAPVPEKKEKSDEEKKKMKDEFDELHLSESELELLNNGTSLPLTASSEEKIEIMKKITEWMNANYIPCTCCDKDHDPDVIQMFSPINGYAYLPNNLFKLLEVKEEYHLHPDLIAQYDISPYFADSKFASLFKGVILSPRGISESEKFTVIYTSEADKTPCQAPGMSSAVASASSSHSAYKDPVVCLGVRV